MIKQIAEWIEAQTGFVIGTKLIVGHAWPSEIDRCSILKEHTGSTLYPDLPDRADFMLQVLSRSNTYMTARDDAYTIYNALYKNRKGPINLGTPGGNLVPNGNFENWTAGVPDDWTVGIAAPSTISQGVSHDGSIACQFNISGGGNVNIAEAIPGMVVGKKYRFSIDYKGIDLGSFRFFYYQNPGVIHYLCFMNSVFGSSAYTTNYNYLSLITDWKKFSIDFESIHTTGTFSLMRYLPANYTFLIDNISIQALDEYVAMTLSLIHI